MMHIFNHACNAISRIAFEERIWGWLPLQRRVYKEVREQFGLQGTQTQVAIHKVAASYKNKQRRQTLSVFQALGSMGLCGHSYKRDVTVRFYGLRIPFQCRPNVKLASKEGQATLNYVNGKWLIHQSMKIEEPAVQPVPDFIGVDLGIRNIAVTSNGITYAGGHVNGLRNRYQRIRKRLQAKQTKSAKRLLKTRRKKECRFARNVNHVIAQQIVSHAFSTGCGIALENLKGIRSRITARSNAQRGKLSSWSFGQLRGFIEYKAKLQGVSVVLVDPRYTSQECPQCGHIDKKNRNRGNFKCVMCGFAGYADTVASTNIRRRALRNEPNASRNDEMQVDLVNV